MSATEQQRSKNTYVGESSNGLRALVTHRSLNREGRYLLPYLDKLPNKFVFADVGCGPGSISVGVAKQYPGALVLGVDVSATEIEEAKALAKAAGVSNARFAVGNALDLDAVANQQGFEDLKGNCDLVAEHMTMMHVGSPLDMIRQMRKAAKVGGLVACRDHDPGMNALFPSSPMLDKYLEYQPHWIACMGADPQAARKLLHFAIQAGFRREHVDTSLGDWVISSQQDKDVWLAYIKAAWEESAVLERMMTATGKHVEPSAMAAAWAEWAKAPDAWYALPAPQIVCRKIQ